MARITKAARVERMTAASEITGRIAAEIEDRADSPDPIESVRARAVVIDARNRRDDLAANLALLKRRPAADLKPITDAEARELDELAAILEERTRKGTLVNKSLMALTEILRTADSIGQILHEV